MQARNLAGPKGMKGLSPEPSPDDSLCVSTWLILPPPYAETSVTLWLGVHITRELTRLSVAVSAGSMPPCGEGEIIGP